MVVGGPGGRAGAGGEKPEDSDLTLQMVLSSSFFIFFYLVLFGQEKMVNECEVVIPMFVWCANAISKLGSTSKMVSGNK